MPRKSPGGARDAVLNVRVPARLKFGLDLISRRYSESISDVIIRALNESLTSENGGLLVYLDGTDHAVDLLRLVWDDIEVVRTVKLALLQPTLLNRTEQLVWAAVKADDKYWAKTPGSKKAKDGAAPARQLEALQVEVLQADWAELVRRASA